MVLSRYRNSWRHIGLLLFLFALSTLSQAETTDENKQQTPDVLFVGNGPLVPQADDQSIPVNFINLEQVDIEILKVTEPGQLLSRHYINDRMSSYDLDHIKHAYQSVFSDRYTLPPSQKDQQTPARLPIPHALPSGWYVVVVKVPGSFYKVKAKHMLLTDVGIQARIHQHQAIFSLARLSTGEAITQGKVEIYRENKLLASQDVNLNGVSRFDFSMKREDIVVARVKGKDAAGKSKEDMAILPMRESPLDLADSKVGGRKYQPAEAYIYSNRDLVKPGETLPINVLLRDMDGRKMSDRPITLSVMNPWNEEILKVQLAPQAAGYYSRELATELSWKTGRYRVEVRLDPTAPTPVSEFAFQLEEFVPERMDLTFESPASFVVAGQTNDVQVKGRYLFGSPAAGNRLKAAVTYQPVQSIPGKFSDYVVGQSFSLDTDYEQLEEQKLSDEGQLRVKLPTPKPAELKSPVKVVANFSLLESGGAAVQRKLNYVTWKKTPVPGIQPQFVDVPYNSDALFHVGLLSSDGQSLVAGELEVTMDYDQGPYYWIYEEGIGWERKKQDRWKQVSAQTIQVKNEPTQLVFPTTWGDYRLTVKDTATDVTTVYDFYAGWYDGSEQLKAKPDHLTMSTDRKAYLAGETAQVTLTAPVAGNLLLTLETDELVWSESYPVQAGDVTIPVPVDAKLARHDLYLTATLTGRDGQVPKRYFGIRPLTLDRSSQQLSVTVTVPDLIHPSETLSVPVTLDNLDAAHSGDTWVTLSVVDKGIINLSRFKPVDPHRYFFEQRRYSADVVDLYSRMYDPRPNPFAQSRFGSDGNDKTENKNDGLVESKTVILMSKPVQVVQGKAVIEMDIPDYNGEVQIIATAFNGSQVGQQVLDKPVSAPVVAELSVPRFLVPGDISTVTVDLHNVSGQPQTLNVSLALSEALALQRQPQTEPLTLQHGEYWSQSFSFRVSDAMVSDRVNLALRVGNDEINIDRDWDVPVRPIMPWVTQVHSAVLEKGASYQAGAGLWSGMDVVQSAMGQAYISRTPVLSPEEHARGLFRYPYGCAEQTTSKAWPFLIQAPELAKFKATVHQSHRQNTDHEGIPADADRQVIETSVLRLKTMQVGTGGFALWDSSGHENPWLTAYVSDFLMAAESRYQGIVPESMLSRAKQRLMAYVRNGSLVDGLAYDGQSADVARAYAAYLTSQQGMLKWSDLDSMQLPELPTQLSYLQLAASYANVGASEQAKDMLEDMKAFDRRRYRYYGDYGSQLRDTAKSVLILDAMAKDKTLQKEARALQTAQLERLPDLSQKRWMSTQERAALVQASALTSAANRDQVFNLAFNDQTVTQQGMFSQPLTTDLVIRNLDEQPAYVKVMAEGYQVLDRTIANASNSFNTLKANSVTRKWYTPTGQPLAGNRVKVGERVVVVLTVNLDEKLNDALLVDKIPAGFVLENPALNQGLPIDRMLPEGVKLNTPEHQEYRNDRFVLSGKLYEDQKYHFGYVLRAEVPGTFAVPPVFIESMYRPEKHLAYWQTPQTFTVDK
ncbi:alpha-2-macroglobulin [Photobacterium sp. 1_MG-2023]|uniref:alpha-2-macroglobulin family protein n=1 Tax=Photobacterium sp. 1_MG-2023 TaxID=3062646 RepID=UPI0026E15262|nr:MG2 domain-containing protein [Photobacterium sp. 1_MG-2023]